MMISSQRYLDDAIVAEKRAAQDYVVSVIDVTINGVSYPVVTDGHHSLAAAKADGVGPVIHIQSATENDRAALTGDDLLEACYIDSEYYDVATGELVF